MSTLTFSIHEEIEDMLLLQNVETLSVGLLLLLPGLLSTHPVQDLLGLKLGHQSFLLH